MTMMTMRYEYQWAPLSNPDAWEPRAIDDVVIAALSDQEYTLQDLRDGMVVTLAGYRYRAVRIAETLYILPLGADKAQIVERVEWA